MISIIVAVSDDWGIGRNNDLLFNIPEDLKRFKRLTTGKTVIMGKKTWYSLPRRPLAGQEKYCDFRHVPARKKFRMQ
jgi:dihydrofolate reductase